MFKINLISLFIFINLFSCQKFSFSEEDLQKLLDEKDNKRTICTIYNDMNGVKLKYKQVMNLFVEAKLYLLN